MILISQEITEKYMTDQEVIMGWIRRCYCGESYGFTVFAARSHQLKRWTNKHFSHCTSKQIKKYDKEKDFPEKP